MRPYIFPSFLLSEISRNSKRHYIGITIIRKIPTNFKYLSEKRKEKKQRKKGKFVRSSILRFRIAIPHHDHAHGKIAQLFAVFHSYGWRIGVRAQIYFSRYGCEKRDTPRERTRCMRDQKSSASKYSPKYWPVVWSCIRAHNPHTQTSLLTMLVVCNVFLRRSAIPVGCDAAYGSSKFAFARDSRYPPN